MQRLLIAAITIIAATSLTIAGSASAAVVAPDASFGDNGAQTLSGMKGYVADVVRAPNGDTLIATTSRRRRGALIQVIKLNSRGKPGPHFGVNGVVTYPVNAIDDLKIAVDRNGSVALLSMEPIRGINSSMRVRRITARGRPDHRFAGRGFKTIYYGDGDIFNMGLLIRRDHRIIAYPGSYNTSGLVNALLPSGRLDKRFGKRGRAEIFQLDDTQLMASGNDNSVYLAGDDNSAAWTAPTGTNFGKAKPVILKLTARGKLDSRFDANGAVVPASSDVFAHFDSLGVSPAGTITTLLSQNHWISEDGKGHHVFSPAQSFVRRLAANGVEKPFPSVDGSLVFPDQDAGLPTDKISADATGFATDGAVARLRHMQDDPVFSFNWISGDGSASFVSGPFELPGKLDPYGLAVVDATRRSFVFAAREERRGGKLRAIAMRAIG